MKLSARNFNPNMLFTWEAAMVMAPAEVKPETTGADTKSTRNPNLNTPKRNCRSPAEKQRNIATSGEDVSLMYEYVNKDMSAVGAMFKSFTVPKQA